MARDNIVFADADGRRVDRVGIENDRNEIDAPAGGIINKLGVGVCIKLRHPGKFKKFGSGKVVLRRKISGAGKGLHLHDDEGLVGSGSDNIYFPKFGSGVAFQNTVAVGSEVVACGIFANEADGEVIVHRNSIIVRQSYCQVIHR